MVGQFVFDLGQQVSSSCVQGFGQRVGGVAKHVVAVHFQMFDGQLAGFNGVVQFTFNVVKVQRGSGGRDVGSFLSGVFDPLNRYFEIGFGGQFEVQVEVMVDAGPLPYFGRGGVGELHCSVSGVVALHSRLRL